MANMLWYAGDGNLKIMSFVEYNGLANAVLENIASNDGPGSIYTSNAGANAIATFIGTFTDTYYAGNVGDEDITITSVDYPLYQDLTIPTGASPPRYIVYNSTQRPLQLSSDAQLNELADVILNFSVSLEGPNSYQLADTPPVDGGTWVNLGQLKNVFSPISETPKYLYKKITASASATVYRPLKSLGQGTIQNFTDTDIELLANKVRDRIVTSGIGQYRFQSSVPTPGVWLNCGTITDTRANVDTISYATEYSSEYAGEIQADYTGSGDVAYEMSIVNTYTFTPEYLGIQPVIYTGTVNYESLGPDQIYVGPTGIYTGPGPSQYFSGLESFVGFVPQDFVGTTRYTGALVTYNNVGTFYSYYLGDYNGSQYVGPGGQYNGPNTTYQSSTYNGIGPPLPGTAYVAGFDAQPQNTGSVFTGTAFYQGTVVQYFTGVISYVSEFSVFTNSSYTGAATQSFSNPNVEFTGSIPAVYTADDIGYTQIITNQYTLESQVGYNSPMDVPYTNDYNISYDETLIGSGTETISTITFWRRIE